MIPKFIRAAGRFGAYAGIGAALVQLVVQVQNMVDALQPEPEHDALVAVLVGPTEDESTLPVLLENAYEQGHAAGYAKAWREGRAEAAEKGADDE